MSIESYIRAAPKAELHVHLEGSIRPETLLTLARRNRVDLPADTPEGLAPWFVFTTFDHFIEVYVAITRCLRRAEDYELITREFGAELARQNARYAEVTFSPSTHHYFGVPQKEFLSGLSRGRRLVREKWGVEINWIFDIVRYDHNCAELADYTTALAIECRDEGVVALGLGGKETSQPTRDFAPWFRRAREAGLRRAPHVGEIDGPASIRAAIDDLGAERLAHGVRAIEDPGLVAELARRRITLDICPTSNLRLGVYPDYASHPLRRLHEAGVSITIGSDDPPLFNTTLNDELVLLTQAFDLDLSAIDGIILNGVTRGFMPEPRKAELEARFRSEMAELKKTHLVEP